ncbi:hypothetical protein SPF06_09870 [Sinomonas sp. JGH33]|uniref:DUF624 domain-containing protein n=1 Tax=Sinomonas terricola TaxID=3110330 RepID=A0ABU5T669_9MICC|nr:hypothetical protein [Sinomonas sp. JGH33]MEA5455024.1 hypothetical protein [Sinomonas sp. JGH33]
MARTHEFGSGPLFTAAARIYGTAVCGFLLVAANLPLVLSPLFLSAPGGMLWLALTAIPVGPAVVAGASAYRRLLAGTSRSVSRDFLRALRSSAADATAVWLPFLGLLTMAGVNLLHLGDLSPQLQSPLRAGLVLFSVLVCTTAINALMIVSRFRFRTRDAVRLAFWCLGARKRASLAIAAVVVLSAWVLTQTTVFLLPFLSGPLVCVVTAISRPVLSLVEERFTVAA